MANTNPGTVSTKHGDFTIPAGLRSDLARKLIEDDSFAHAWICHEGIAANCPDGCDGAGGCPERARLYLAIDRVAR